MSLLNIILPSKPRIVSEDDARGIYEIDNLYPGYGHTLGNSLRRIILSSLPGAAVTLVKIDGVSHEFSVIDGVKEDVVTILLNLKKIRFRMISGETETVTLSVKGPKSVTASDIKTGSQIEILNPDLHIAEITDKNHSLSIEMTIERGLGFVEREDHKSGKVDIGTIALDAIFTPIRRVSYEVENMRVGGKTDHNRLRLVIETDGTITPREALEQSLGIMISQLQAIANVTPLHVSAPIDLSSSKKDEEAMDDEGDSKEDLTDSLKTRIDTIGFSARTLHALTEANIRTVGGIARKKKEDLLAIDGIGEKGIQEIKKILKDFGISLKE